MWGYASYSSHSCCHLDYISCVPLTLCAVRIAAECLNSKHSSISYQENWCLLMTCFRPAAKLCFVQESLFAKENHCHIKVARLCVLHFVSPKCRCFLTAPAVNIMNISTSLFTFFKFSPFHVLRQGIALLSNKPPEIRWPLKLNM